MIIVCSTYSLPDGVQFKRHDLPQLKIFSNTQLTRIRNNDMMIPV